MIRFDLETFAGGYFFTLLGVLVFLWLFSFRRKKAAEQWNMTDHVKRCPYCGHVFIDQTGQGPMKCPLCESYLEVFDADQAKK